MRPGPIPSVEPGDAAARLAEPDAPLLIDVRERDEFDTVRIADAVLVPMSELQARAGELPERPLLVYCHSGGRSMAATNYLRALGRDATNVTGGIVAWSRAGLPVRTGAPIEGEGSLPAASR
ncbi:MAG TPA: rhodanese-like domain-containing protein [Candidatus Limnocylindrales bacterium]|nr:rhodanese-like domain-containing protein [Candidatus Limnocylindrales bacterium]